jgi:hypothetical protein
VSATKGADVVRSERRIVEAATRVLVAHPRATKAAIAANHYISFSFHLGVNFQCPKKCPKTP